MSQSESLPCHGESQVSGPTFLAALLLALYSLHMGWSTLLDHYQHLWDDMGVTYTPTP